MLHTEELIRASRREECRVLGEPIARLALAPRPGDAPNLTVSEWARKPHAWRYGARSLDIGLCELCDGPRGALAHIAMAFPVQASLVARMIASPRWSAECDGGEWDPRHPVNLACDGIRQASLYSLRSAL